ncbi:MAG: hypothetical protein D6731_24275, partial [Planctomycetota bacterium]
MPAIRPRFLPAWQGRGPPFSPNSSPRPLAPGPRRPRSPSGPGPSPEGRARPVPLRAVAHRAGRPRAAPARPRAAPARPR